MRQSSLPECHQGHAHTLYQSHYEKPGVKIQLNLLDIIIISVKLNTGILD